MFRKQKNPENSKKQIWMAFLTKYSIKIMMGSYKLLYNPIFPRNATANVYVMPQYLMGVLKGLRLLKQQKINQVRNVGNKTFL
jgi:hypothetical protein